MFKVQGLRFKSLRKPSAWGYRGLRILLALSLLAIYHLPFTIYRAYAEEYKFDAAEAEKKPYSLGGYIEYMPMIFGLDKGNALYQLNYYNRQMNGTAGANTAAVQLEGSFEKGITRFYSKIYSYYANTYPGETAASRVFEGHLSLKPTSSFMMDFGKKTMNWGKGYAWNPAAFLDRPKDPNDPELSREGYIVAAADYTKSFGGPLKTFSFTSVLMPVYCGVNDDFGEVRHINAAAKAYFLLYDTDIDFMVFTGGSTTTRYGMDFSRNITTNLEVHGEGSLITNFNRQYIDSFGRPSWSQYDAVNYLLGLRYLTVQDTTYILEYYRNGTGYGAGEMSDFYSFVNTGYNLYKTTGNAALINQAVALSNGAYGRMNPGKDYLYLRVSQKDPFDFLYWTPAITLIANVNDRSFSLAPEIMYTGITNLELRFRTFFLTGQKGSEYGEKQNDFRIDFRVRYYF
jgi:hypothetical protein